MRAGFASCPTVCFLLLPEIPKAPQFVLCASDCSRVQVCWLNQLYCNLILEEDLGTKKINLTSSCINSFIQLCRRHVGVADCVCWNVSVTFLHYYRCSSPVGVGVRCQSNRVLLLLPRGCITLLRANLDIKR